MLVILLRNRFWRDKWHAKVKNIEHWIVVRNAEKKNSRLGDKRTRLEDNKETDFRKLQLDYDWH